MRAQIHTLSLAYPPISNQEAEWLKDDHEVSEHLQNTQLYMVTKRQEVYFREFSYDEMFLRFEVFAEGLGTDSAEIDLSAAARGAEHFEVEMGEKCVRVWETDQEGDPKRIIDWFSTEKLLWDRSREHPAVSGLERFREFLTYELLYIGISKESNALKRLVEKPHEKRIEMLSNEHPIVKGSRVSDELYFLFFDIGALHFHTLDLNDEFALTPPESLEMKRVVADAEKAFVHILKGRYNKIRFENYPKSKDGLGDFNLSRYCYVINEDLILNTTTARIRGERPLGAVTGNNADMIAIEGDDVRLLTPDDLVAPVQADRDDG